LPNACLAAIIVIALKNMILQITQLPKIFKQSQLEAIAWIVTFSSVIILDVDIGLYIGVFVTLMLCILRSQRPRMSIMGKIESTDIYECLEICEECQEIPGVKILRYEESIFYANVDDFKYKVIKFSGLNDKIKHDKKFKKGNQSLINDNLTKHIILDCSCINNIDTQGINGIAQLYEDFKEVDINLHLTFCKPSILKSFQKSGFNFSYEFVYPTTHDAIISILNDKRDSL
jgi:MFS superfamily sulfate permease-like transporter